MFKTLKKGIYALFIRLREKRYHNLRYILLKPSGKQGGGCKTLIISFAGFSPDMARYNYIRTLRSIDCYRLFLLDDHGFEKRGSYYLDTVDEGNISNNVLSLVDNVKSGKNIEHIYSVGSSKGGSCALLFGLRLCADACIIGAPQYRIGSYLNFEEHRNLLKAIVGEITEDKIEELDNLIYEELKNNTRRDLAVYLHFSKYENTYKSQIVDLIDDLNDFGYPLYLDDDYEYTDHSEVSKYFPQYMMEKCKELMRASE